MSRSTQTPSRKKPHRPPPQQSKSVSTYRNDRREEPEPLPKPLRATETQWASMQIGALWAANPDLIGLPIRPDLGAARGERGDSVTIAAECSAFAVMLLIGLSACTAADPSSAARPTVPCGLPVCRGRCSERKSKLRCSMRRLAVEGGGNRWTQSSDARDDST